MNPLVEAKHRRDHLPRVDLDKRVAVEISDCWRCQKAQAHCRTKVRYPDPIVASLASQDINVATEWERMLVPYRCRWCSEWHLTSTSGKTSRTDRTRAKRVEKRRRRWLTAERGQ